MIRRIVMTLCVAGLVGAASLYFSHASTSSSTLQVAARSGYIVASS